MSSDSLADSFTCQDGASNIHARDGISEEQFVALRLARDAALEDTLCARLFAVCNAAVYATLRRNAQAPSYRKVSVLTLRNAGLRILGQTSGHATTYFPQRYPRAR